MLRIRRVLSANKGDQGLIDLHSGNFSDGGPALSYMMFFRAATPFLDVVALAVSLTPKTLSPFQRISTRSGSASPFTTTARRIHSWSRSAAFRSGCLATCLAARSTARPTSTGSGPTSTAAWVSTHPFLILLGRWLSLANAMNCVVG